MVLGALFFMTRRGIVERFKPFCQVFSFLKFGLEWQTCGGLIFSNLTKIEKLSNFFILNFPTSSHLPVFLNYYEDIFTFLYLFQIRECHFCYAQLVTTDYSDKKIVPKSLGFALYFRFLRIFVFSSAMNLFKILNAVGIYSP